MSDTEENTAAAAPEVQEEAAEQQVQKEPEQEQADPNAGASSGSPEKEETDKEKETEKGAPVAGENEEGGEGNGGPSTATATNGTEEEGGEGSGDSAEPAAKEGEGEAGESAAKEGGEGEGKEEGAEGEDKDKDKERRRSKDRERRSRRRSSRSRSRGRGSSRRDRDRGDKDKDKDKEGEKGGEEKERRRDRDRSGSRDSSRRKRDRSRDRDRPSRRARRSASKSPSPTARRQRREKRSSNWDKPPEPGQEPPPASTTAAVPPVAGGLGGVLGGGLPGQPLASTYIEPPMLDPGVMMGTVPVSNPSLHGGVIRGAIGTLTAPTAPPNAQEIFNGIMIPTNMLRQAKRLYVGNVPMGCDQFVLMQLFNQAMVAAGKGSAMAPPIVGVQVNENKPFAFLETRTPEDAPNVLLFDGLTIGANQLKVRRPKDFKPLPGIVDPPVGTTVVQGSLPTSVAETENKIYLGSIPNHFNELQVRELVSAFGELKAFNLVKDVTTGLSKGFCFFEYVDTSLTDRVCAELNGFELGDRKLICQRANTPSGAPARPSASSHATDPYSAAALMGGMGMATATAPPALGPPTRILKLSNMVVAEELQDDQEYEDIVADIREECTKYGVVLSLRVPRPNYHPGGGVAMVPPGVGEVYVEFADPSGAMQGANALRNRQFSNRTVLCSFFNEHAYAMNNLG